MDRKHRFILLIGIVFMMAGCSKDKVRITGTIEHGGSAIVKLYETRVYSNKFIDSVQVKKNGTFHLTVPIKNKGFYLLNINDTVVYDLLVAPGDKIHLELDALLPYGTTRLEGSPESVKLLELNTALRATRRKIDSLQTVYNMAEAGEKEQLELAYKDIIKKHKRYSTQFLLQNLSSLVSVSALYQEVVPGVFLFNTKRDLQFFKLVNDSLQKYYPDQRQVKALEENFAQLMSDYHHEQLLQKLPKQQVISIPEIKLPDVQGNEQSLLAIKKRYVLLHFWSSINSSSIEMNPELKRVYERFNKKGFEVYAVSVDGNLARWKKAVEFEELNWINVCDTAFLNSQTQVVYNVQQIPTNYLIDLQSEEIISRQLSAAKLNSLLEDLLK